MAKRLDCLRIHLAENGGTRVVHEFKRQPTKGMASHVYMERPNEEEHIFGPGQEGKLKAHINKALGMAGAAEPEGDEE